ncbi:MAG: hypothetical protein N3D80_03840 [Ignavibacterium album]|uniref:hypothetical protein n=1 Tax=Ignavibacterium album TaxID=591197 RepID=UPI0026EA0758|nr:hypothetical protein [Ignavibacterium album]MCX8104989.1 hypothetical protein [Ignavibacterium album]
MLKKLILIAVLIITEISLAQVTPQTQLYREEPKGNIQFRREGVMDGNQIRTLFYNNGEVGQWPYQPSGEWPKGSGHSYLDGVCVLIASEVTAPGTGQKIHPLETSYREWMDKDPSTGEIWGLEPVPGYVNPSSTKPAINTDPKSWPDFWPVALNLTPEWNGYWYGYFGRGVLNSDFETFFVMDDSRDKEFTRTPFNYYPIASDQDRGGLGLRVEVRGFQWSHVLAEDIIFWHYDIVNISDFSYPTTLFGFYTDCGVGGTDDSEDDNASFDLRLDLAYCYDSNGLGVPDNWQTGYYGYAYLESPGNGFDGIDNDQDGLIDERRDDGIDNDGDWIPYSDLNGNGEWDPDENEPLNNDVGKDGVGPFDRQYTGPDEGEGDGIPTDGEPNFDKTDKDESDQIGLTAVSIYRLGQGGTGGGWPKDDESMWLKMTAGTFDTSLQRANISMVFASGPFPLYQNLRERFSMALVFGENLDDIMFNKETVQQIYNANYNFSKPPIKPILTAIPGDQKVILYWDNIAEESRDPFLGYQNGDPTQGYKKDFEGYLIYRSTEPEFNDIKVITDSKGSPKYWKPIAQFDLKDGIKGPDPVGINGAHFWRGDDTGLQYSYVDTDVKNGVKYYYACVSYDMGDPNFGTAGLQPSECTKIITEDFAGNLQFVDINCAVVVPNAPVAGYVPPQIQGDTKHVSEGVGTGSLQLSILDPRTVLEGAQYSIEFSSSNDYPLYHSKSYKIIKTYNGVTDTILTVDSTYFGVERISPPFDGMAISVLNDTVVTIIDTLTGWLVGNSNLIVYPFPDATPIRGIPWPADYEITFYDTPQDTCYIQSPPLYRRFPVNLKVWNKTEGKYSKIAVKDNDGSQSLTIGDQIQILEFQGAISPSNVRFAWNLTYDAPFDPNATPIYPANGDKYLISTTKQFKTGDKFIFTTKAVNVDKNLAKEQLSKIDVVPNPYLGAAVWERRNLNSTGRGERKIDFINLPNQCTIRIYTITGQLIKTLYKDSGFLDGTISWNLVTDDGMDAAYGVYVYHVDAPGVGEYIGKFALIK